MKAGRSFARLLAVAALLASANSEAAAQDAPKGDARANTSPTANLSAADAAAALMTNFGKGLSGARGPEALSYAPTPELSRPRTPAFGAGEFESEGEAREPRVTFRIASRDHNHPARLEDGGVTILQIGDSHTAADFFTGEVRRRLQARYGDGGPGYVDAGKPHPGIRTASFNVTASSGWTYSALQKSENTADFYLSGFAAKTARSGELLAFSARRPVPYDLVEIEVSTGPKSGSINVALDALAPFRHNLATAHNDHVVYRFIPEGDATGQLQKISITTAENLPVAISSIGIFNRHYGVSYSNIGFPGATVDLLNRFDSGLFRDELRRLAPQIVVLGFGTNEGFDDNLDLDRYRQRYLVVIGRIRASLPDVKIVIIGPPQAGRKSSGCTHATNCRHPADADQCAWPSPPQLSHVRDVQREIAKEQGLAFWDWAAIMPAKCGALAWHVAATPLIAADGVHLTPDGYRLSAGKFAEFLFPLVDQFKSKDYALSHQ
jgi:lysophospholipase L1-like esterase